MLRLKKWLLNGVEKCCMKYYPGSGHGCMRLLGQSNWGNRREIRNASLLSHTSFEFHIFKSSLFLFVRECRLLEYQHIQSIYIIYAIYDHIHMSGIPQVERVEDQSVPYCLCLYLLILNILKKFISFYIQKIISFEHIVNCVYCYIVSYMKITSFPIKVTPDVKLNIEITFFVFTWCIDLPLRFRH